MTTTTAGHRPGSFCWIELTTNDVAAARKFYTELFGWNVNARWPLQRHLEPDRRDVRGDQAHDVGYEPTGVNGTQRESRPSP